MSKVNNSFWDVQGVWERTKLSPSTLGHPHSNSCSQAAATIDEDLSGRLLKLLDDKGSFDSYELSVELCVDHQQVVGAIKSIQSLGEVRVTGIPQEYKCVA
jgi:hypothetical protein